MYLDEIVLARKETQVAVEVGWATKVSLVAIPVALRLAWG